MSDEQHPTITIKTNQLIFAIFKAALYPTQCPLTEEDEAEIKRKVQKVMDIPEDSSQKYTQSISAIIGFYAGYLNIESRAVRQYAKNSKKEILAEVKQVKLDLKTDEITNLLGLTHGAMRWLWFFHPHDECDDITFVGWYRVTAEKQLVVLEAEAKNRNKDLFVLSSSNCTVEDIDDRNIFIQLLLTAQDYRPEKLPQINDMMDQLKALMHRLHSKDSKKKQLKRVEQLYLLLYYYSNLVRQLMSMPPLTRSA